MSCEIFGAGLLGMIEKKKKGRRRRNIEVLMKPK